MKLSFSIQNWNALSWSEFCAVASDVKLQGIEIYNVNGPAFQGKSSPANPELAAATRRSLIRQGLTVPCIGTVLDFTDADFRYELDECVELAGNLGVENIGIRTSCEDQDRCADRLAGFMDKLGDGPVRLLIETTGAYADSARLRATLRNARTREVFSLTGNRVSIGRSAACDITVSSPTASRRHALLILYEDGWAIDDSGSTHGTYLNGERVTSPQLLFPGDVIRIGSDKLVFQ